MLPCEREKKKCSLYRFSQLSGLKLQETVLESLKGISLSAKLSIKLPCHWKCRKSYMSISVFKNLISNICNNAFGIKISMVYDIPLVVNHTSKT